MHTRRSQPARLATLLLAITLLAACANRNRNTLDADAASVAKNRVRAALDRWPSEVKRPFFTTIHVAGRRTTAHGILDFHGPRDMRITALTELGMILFDARVTWAGVTVHRSLPGVETAVVESLVRDIVRALDKPNTLDQLAEDPKSGGYVLTYSNAENYKHVFNFDGDGRLYSKEVHYGMRDKLRIQYTGYSADGRVRDLVLQRPMRFYRIQMSFTD